MEDRTIHPIWYFVGTVGVAALVMGAVSRSSGLSCSTKFYPARLRGGTRKASQLRLIVMHSTESTGSAANVASYFQSPSSGGSTQVVVGEDGCFRCVGDLETPAGAPGANLDGLHIEVVGRAAWTRAEWLQNAPRALVEAARVLAYWSKTYKIPLAELDVAAVKDPRRRGVVTHKTISQAFKQSDHVDPGPGFPLDWVLARARMM